MVRIPGFTGLLAALALLFSSCDPMSYSDYRMEAYDGAFIWEEVSHKAAWSNRYDHAAVAFDGKLWVEGELGIMTPSHMRHGSNDFIGLDGVYYFAIAGNPTEWLHLRFSKHHICTHIGDEFPKRTATSVTDRNPMYKQGPVMDDMRFAAAVRPLWFLGRPPLDILMLYGEVGYFDPGSDFLGMRKMWPTNYAYMNYQCGVELEYYFTSVSRWLDSAPGAG